MFKRNYHDPIGIAKDNVIRFYRNSVEGDRSIILRHVAPATDILDTTVSTEDGKSEFGYLLKITNTTVNGSSDSTSRLRTRRHQSSPECCVCFPIRGYQHKGMFRNGINHFEKC